MTIGLGCPGGKSAMAYALVIGSKTVSSWSLRPWLALVQAGIPFQEIMIPLRQRTAQVRIGRGSHAGLVAGLMLEDRGEREVIVDRLALLEFLAEPHPEAALWPAQKAARAHARAICAEMHAGFRDLREHCA